MNLGTRLYSADITNHRVVNEFRLFQVPVYFDHFDANLISSGGHQSHVATHVLYINSTLSRCRVPL